MATVYPYLWDNFHYFLAFMFEIFNLINTIKRLRTGFMRVKNTYQRSERDEKETKESDCMRMRLHLGKGAVCVSAGLWELQALGAPVGRDAAGWRLRPGLLPSLNSLFHRCHNAAAATLRAPRFHSPGTDLPGPVPLQDTSTLIYMLHHKQNKAHVSSVPAVYSIKSQTYFHATCKDLSQIHEQNKGAMVSTY